MFVYAIGEIFLVVVGIMLAIQVYERKESARNENIFVECNNIGLNLETDIVCPDPGTESGQ